MLGQKENIMEVSKERLSIIGRMIGIYREEKRGNTQNSFTQKRFCKDICSTNTLKNIEKGELARSIDVYTELLAKFHLKLGEFPAIDMAIMKLTDELYDAIEYYNNDAISILTNKALRLLNEVRNYAYYSELFDLFNNVFEYYQNDIFIDYGKVERYKNIMYLMDIKYADFYRLLIFAKMRPECTSSVQLFKELVDEINLQNCKHEFIKINLLQYYYSLKKFKVMNALVIELEDYFTKTENKIRLLDILNYSIVLNSYIDFDDCKVYSLKAEKFISLNKLPPMKEGEVYSNIAISFYVNDEFEIALEYFNKMLKYPYVNALDKFIFMADSQNHLGLDINIPIIEDNDFKKFPNDIKIMYKYFTLGNTIPPFVKENYILKEIVPFLTNELYIKVFRYELVKLISYTNHYKKLHVFDENFKKIADFS